MRGLATTNELDNKNIAPVISQIEISCKLERHNSTNDVINILKCYRMFKNTNLFWLGVDVVKLYGWWQFETHKQNGNELGKIKHVGLNDKPKLR